MQLVATVATLPPSTRALRGTAASTCRGATAAVSAAALSLAATSLTRAGPRGGSPCRDAGEHRRSCAMGHDVVAVPDPLCRGQRVQPSHAAAV